MTDADTGVGPGPGARAQVEAGAGPGGGAEGGGGGAAGELTQILARLVAAGVEQPAAWAALLGLHEADVGRPRRALLRAGLAAADAHGALHLTPRGQAWLRLPPAQEPSDEPRTLDLPALDPLPPLPEPIADPRAAREPLPPLLELIAAPGAAPEPLPPLPPIPESTPRRQPRLFGFRLRAPVVPLPVPRGLELVLGRRVAMLGASALLVIVAGEAGFYSFGRASPEPLPPPATPAPLAITPAPTPTSTPEHWMVVQHTNGLGLVLRPAPASTARVLLLRDGARVRVTGAAVQQAGHAWLPVTSTNGTSGWVAGEYLVPEAPA